MYGMFLSNCYLWSHWKQEHIGDMYKPLKLTMSQWHQWLSISTSLMVQFEGILPKGPYLPCLSMAGRALLAGYHRIMRFLVWRISCKFSMDMWVTFIVPSECTKWSYSASAVQSKHWIHKCHGVHKCNGVVTSKWTNSKTGVIPCWIFPTSVENKHTISHINGLVLG